MTKREIWMAAYEKLHQFWEEHGSSSVPYEHEMYDWCEMQRNDIKLAKYKKELLNEVDFVWDTKIHPDHEKNISKIYNAYKKTGGFESSKESQVSNFIRLCIYRHRKGVLPKNLQHAFAVRSIDLD